MVRTPSPLYSAAWFGILGLLTLKVAFDSSLRYFTGLEPPPPPIVANAFAQPFLMLHVVGGVAALLVGPIQFVRAIRTRWPAFHRLTGRIYVGACAIGAPTGLVLAFGTTAGPIAGAGFAMLGLLWLLFTGLGLRSAMAGRISEHREWMLRSYAMAAGAITLRLMLPAAGAAGIGFLPAYQVIAWLSWIVNLLLVEYWIRRSRQSASGISALATA